MTREEYRAALISRGFFYHEDIDQWIGPYNIKTTGYMNYDIRSFADAARDDVIAYLDEQLRAKRGGFRVIVSGGPGPGLL